jgi:hypothetical protein
MSSCFLIRQHSAPLFPDRQEIFLYPPDQGGRLYVVSVTPEEFRERLRREIDRVGRKNVIRPYSAVSEGGLSKILSGAVADPGVFRVLSLCEATGVTLGSLLGERGYELTTDDQRLLAEFVAWAKLKVEPEMLLSVGRESPADDTPSSVRTSTDKAHPVVPAGEALDKPKAPPFRATTTPTKGRTRKPIHDEGTPRRSERGTGRKKRTK